MPEPEVKMTLSLGGYPVGIATLVKDENGYVRIAKADFSAHPANLKAVYEDFGSRLPVETGLSGSSDG